MVRRQGSRLLPSFVPASGVGPGHGAAVPAGKNGPGGLARPAEHRLLPFPQDPWAEGDAGRVRGLVAPRRLPVTLYTRLRRLEERAPDPGCPGCSDRRGRIVLALADRQADGSAVPWGKE